DLPDGIYPARNERLYIPPDYIVWAPHCQYSTSRPMDYYGNDGSYSPYPVRPTPRRTGGSRSYTSLSPIHQKARSSSSSPIHHTIRLIQEQACYVPCG